MQTSTVPEVIRHTSTRDFVISTVEIIIDPAQPPVYETMIFHKEAIAQHRTTDKEVAFSVHLHYAQLIEKLEQLGEEMP